MLDSGAIRALSYAQQTAGENVGDAAGDLARARAGDIARTRAGEYARAQAGEYARAQADLVAALTGTGPVPDGFDAGRLDVAVKALLRKRAGEVARYWPMLRVGLGDRFGAEFAAWAAHRPTTGPWRDGWDFALALAGRSELPEPAELELARYRLRWRYDGTSVPRRRRLPAARFVAGRLFVQIAGRITVIGR